MSYAVGAGFRRDRGPSLSSEFWIPGRRQVDGSREHRSNVITVQRLLNEQSRNAEAIMCNDPLLYGVRLRRSGIYIVNPPDAEAAPQEFSFRGENAALSEMCVLSFRSPSKIPMPAYKSSCLIFSSNVMRRKRSSIRCSIGAFGFL